MANLYPVSLEKTLTEVYASVLAQALQRMAELEAQNLELTQQLEQKTQALDQKSQDLEAVFRELQNSQAHLIQMEKMSMLGQMIAGISHEINNPVNFIYGNLPYIEEHLQDLLMVLQAYQTHASQPSPELAAVLEHVDLEFVLEDLPRILSSMKIGTDRIRELVLNLRNFYRLDEAEMQITDLHAGIESTLVLLHNRYKHKVEIVREYGDLPEIECHINQINQVFMNLISNAIDALLEHELQGQSDLPKSTCSKPNSQVNSQVNQITIHTQRMGDDWVSVRISDNGPGIPAEILSRLFEAFFTTKPRGIGTGLGLSISHQIVTQTHHGRIYCCSSPGEGTTFMLELPVRQPRVNLDHPPTAIASSSTGLCA